MSGGREFGSIRQVIGVLLVAAFCMSVRPSIANAQSEATSAASSDAQAVAASDSPHEADTHDKSEAGQQSELRQQSAMAGLLVLALLCIVFLTLIVCVVLWARRMRRLTSQPLPKQHPGDPLWYLRKSSAETNADDEES